MKTIKFKVNYKEYKLQMSDIIYDAVTHMNQLKTIKKRLRYHIKSSTLSALDSKTICKFSYITTKFNNISFNLYYVKDNIFELKEV